MEAEEPQTSQSIGKSADEENEDRFISDSERLRRILPEEIWEVITEKLRKTSPGDCENHANSSAYFRNLLASQRTFYLFEKVFPLVASSVWKKEGVEGLPVSEVLNCRGVSLHWNIVIDKLIYEHFQHFGKESGDSKDIRIVNAFKSVTENSLDNGTDGTRKTVYDFLLYFKHTHPGNQNQPKARNPFIWGDVCVNIQAREYDDLEAVSILFSKHGIHIHGLDLQTGGYFTWDRNMKRLQHWFSNLPNLRKLTFHGKSGEWYSSRVLISKWRVPRFKLLEKLDTCALPAPLFNKLIRRSGQVSTLSIASKNVDDYIFFTFPFPNLKTLIMGICSADNMEKLRSPRVGWPLESLTLMLNEGCSAYFQVIQDKFANTLVSLDLDIDENEFSPECTMWQDCKNCRLDLPNLRKIVLRMNDKPVCLDFLLPMKHNLEEIPVRTCSSFPTEQNELIPSGSGTIIQYIGFEMKMLASNIWSIFTKLKLVQVNESEFYREELMTNNVDA